MSFEQSETVAFLFLSRLERGEKPKGAVQPGRSVQALYKTLRSLIFLTKCCFPKLQANRPKGRDAKLKGLGPDDGL